MQQQIPPRVAANVLQRPAQAPGVMRGQQHQQQQDNQQQLYDQIVHVRTNFQIQAGRMITQDPFNDAMCMVIWPDYYIRSIRFNILANLNPHNRICLKTGLLGIKKLVKQICDINRDDLLTTYFASFEQTMPR